MRKELRKREGERATLTATFSRYGSRNNWNGFPEKTYLLKDMTQWGDKADEGLVDIVIDEETKEEINRLNGRI